MIERPNRCKRAGTFFFSPFCYTNQVAADRFQTSLKLGFEEGVGGRCISSDASIRREPSDETTTALKAAPFTGRSR